MNTHSFSFIPLLLVILIAFFVPIFLTRFRKLGIPVVVGEILAGMIVGQSGFGLVQEDHVLEILAILGFSLLMFLSGLEINFDSLFSETESERQGVLGRALNNSLVFGGILFGLTLTGAFATATVIHRLDLVSEPWIIALVLSTTSLGVVVPVLKERGFMVTSYGQRILASALVADLASILAISIYVLLHSQGLTLDILLILVLFAVFIAVHRLTALFQKHLPTEKILERMSSPTSQVKLRGAIALALVFIALAESLGIENILGAFLAGVILSMASSGNSSNLRMNLDSIGYGFFIPIFFVMVGVRFDLPALLSSREALLLVPFMLVAAYLIKILPALLFREFYSWRRTLAAGFIMSSRLSLIIAASAIGFQLGVISAPLNSSIVLVAIVSCTLSPIVFNLLLKSEAVSRDHVLIAGSHPMRDFLNTQLEKHGKAVTSIQPNAMTVERLKALGILSTDTLIVLESELDTNLKMCQMATDYFNIENIISLVNDPRRNDQFRDIGVRVVNDAYSTALIIESMALSKEAFSMAQDLDQLQEVRQVRLTHAKAETLTIVGLGLPEGVNVLHILRGNELITPDHNTHLQIGDVLTLVGNEDRVMKAVNQLSAGG